eukprot:1547591-Amphidinium_carterae.2
MKSPTRAGHLPAPPSRWPITVASSLWRIYARARLSDFDTLLEYQLDPLQVGGRPQKSTVDAITHCKLFHDAGQLRDKRRKAGSKPTHMYAVQLDLAKCFNRIRMSDCLRLWSAWHFPQHLIRFLAHFYKSAHVRHRYANGMLGQIMRYSRGLPQGDPLSAAAENTVLWMVLQAIRDEAARTGCSFGTPESDASCVMYLDDLTIMCRSAHHLATLSGAALRAFESLGMVVNYDKTVLCSDDDEFVVPTCFPDNVSIVNRFELLGADMLIPGVGNIIGDLSEKRRVRSEKALARLERISHIPGEEEYRALLIGAMCSGLWSYVPLGLQETPQQVTANRRLVQQTLVGSGRRLAPETSPEVHLGILHKAHTVQPGYVQLASMARIIRICFEQHPALMDKLSHARTSIWHELEQVCAPLSIVVEKSRLVSTYDTSSCLSFTKMRDDMSAFMHALRTFIRAHLIASVWPFDTARYLPLQILALALHEHSAE